jgi:hypothetical protein
MSNVGFVVPIPEGLLFAQHPLFLLKSQLVMLLTLLK